MNKPPNFRNELLLRYIAIIPLFVVSVNAMYSMSLISPTVTTPSPPPSQPIIKKLTSTEIELTSNDIFEKSRKCGDRDDCFYYFLFGCLCYPPEMTRFSPPNDLYRPSHDLRLKGFVAPSQDTPRPRSRTPCVIYCAGRYPCYCSDV